VLEKLWPVLQHGLLLMIPAVASVLLPWASSELIPALGQLDPRYATIATALVSLIALVATPLTKQYGVVLKPKADTSARGSDPNA
jgi:hypothetical protein